jgi:hypothetical protein
MHFDLKPISKESIPEALAKVERYRLLNEPRLAESICLDILRVSPGHKEALIALLLARTDQFGGEGTAARTQEVLAQIKGDYEHAYYEGLIWERIGHARLRQGRLGSGATAYQAFRTAMALYERAEPFSPPGNDDAILRWNTCARVIMENPEIRPIVEDEKVQPITGE